MDNVSTMQLRERGLYRARARRVWLGLVMLAVLLLGLATTAVAEPESAAGEDPGTSSEPISAQEFQKLLLSPPSDFTGWRKRADNILKANPKSYQGDALLGLVMHRGEGDLPRARFHLTKAKEEARFEGQFFYLLILLELDTVLGEMDEYTNRLANLDDLARINGNPLIAAMRVWPLMKLGREKEARACLDRAFASSDVSTRLVAWNSLGALEGELGHTQAAMRAFESLIAEAEAAKLNKDCTYMRNAGEMSLALGRYEVAEKYFLDSLKLPFSPETYSNPYQDLTNLYLGQARFPEAVQSAKKMLQWSAALKPFLYQQCVAEDATIVGQVYLELGLINEAINRLAYIVQRPDRQGGSSVSQDRSEAGSLLVWRIALLTQVECISEDMASAHGFAWWKMLWNRARLKWDADSAGEKLTAMIVKNDHLEPSLRPYAAGGIIVNEWFRPALVPLFGSGVCAAALDNVKKNPSEKYDLEKPFLDVMYGEIACNTGNYRAATDYYKNAIKTLPSAEVLLCSWAQARLGYVQEKSGDRAAALASFQQALQHSPTEVRRVGAYLPITVHGSGAAVQQVAEMLDDSPRFSVVSDGFPMQITLSGKKLTASLLGKDGTVLATATSDVADNVRDSAAGLAVAIHRQVFSPKISLDQLDMNSLDGSNVSTSMNANENIKEIFSGDDSGGTI